MQTQIVCMAFSLLRFTCDCGHTPILKHAYLEGKMPLVLRLRYPQWADCFSLLLPHKLLKVSTVWLSLFATFISMFPIRNAYSVAMIMPLDVGECMLLGFIYL